MAREHQITKRRVSRWVRRLVEIIVIVEIAWLVVVNGLLHLPLTQTAINMIRPEKFNISWAKAWSWYPGQVNLRGATATGNAPSQMWQLDVGSVSGTISLLPLILKRVWVDGVEGSDVVFRLRPRPKPERDDSRIEAWFPEIEGREVTPAVPRPGKKWWPWRVAIDDISLAGPLDYWIYHVRGRSGGELHGDFSYVSRGGEFELDVHAFDLDLGRHVIAGDQEMFGDGRIRGSMGFAPFVPQENRGLPLLGFLFLDAEVDIDLNDLRFVQVFVLDFEQIKVGGEGRVGGRLRFDRGIVLEGTDLAIDARDLTVDVPGHRIEGKGDVDLEAGTGTEDAMDLDFRFRELEVFHEGFDQPMLAGEELLFSVGGDGRILPDPERVNRSRRLSLSIDGIAVPDLARLQQYLPPKWSLRLLGGSGELSGVFRMTPTALDVDLSLQSRHAELALSSYRFDSDLEAAVRLHNPSIMDRSTKVAGSYIRLSNAHLLREDQPEEADWNASLEFNDGDFRLFNDQDRAAREDVRDLFRILGNSEFSGLLAGSSGQFDFEAEMSSLAWLNAFLGSEYESEFHGSSAIDGTLALDAGLPAPGTDIEVRSDELAVRVLDYLGHGDGVVRLQVEEGGAAPDWRIRLDLAGAELRRRDEDSASLHDVELSLEALVEDVTFDPDRKRRFALDFDIASARVTDLSVFNRYLPPDSPMRFAGGEADLVADTVLHHDDADGWIRLDSSDVRLVADEQSLNADLYAEILLQGGMPAEQVFDIRGSSLRLDRVRVDGEDAEFDESAWNARLELEHGVVTITEPVAMDLKAALRVSDSRPLVALFRNQDGWRPEFLARMMTVEDIEGRGDLRMANQRMVIPKAWLTSNNVEAGLKAVIAPDFRDGMLYFRYKKFDALLKMREGRRNLDILNARKKYDAYHVPAD